jgi:hypothetical protein
MFPGTPIVLLLTHPRDFFMRDSTRHALLRPAVSFLPSPADSVLIHVLSNGGAHKFCDMLSLSPHLGLGETKILFDSTPGEIALRPTAMAFLAPVRVPVLRLAGSLLLALMYMVMVWLPTTMFGSLDFLQAVRERLNDPSILSTTSTKRTYIYSDLDDLVQSWAVEKHAADAMQKGYAVDLVKMPDSMHVEHLRRHPELYQAVVMSLWRA